MLQDHSEIVVGHDVLRLEIDCHSKLVHRVIRPLLTHVKHSKVDVSRTAFRINQKDTLVRLFRMARITGILVRCAAVKQNGCIVMV